ncbi:MAG: site-specific DNA-methyltransferase [Deltaproteobacteria bacterium]|nr:site-specific DNA-methyltransferase [Deltaproteobacteria bacterium]
MPTTEQLRGRLIDKLKELFQLDQPDLDFGFYRIMHARAEQITDFLTTDLLKIVENAFGKIDDVTKKKLKAEYDQELQKAKDYGAPEPENVLKVKEAKAKYEAASHTESTEGEIYDHLYRFFERYYDNGDLASPYAIPYNGEEVKLHWANADQYYIKTAEYFTNFTFDLRLAVKKQQELSDKNKKGHKQKDLLTFTEATTSILTHMALKVNFRIIEAAEGEHGNIKAGNATKRFFIIHKNNPVEFNKNGELIVNFEYRPDPKKTGQEKIWRDKRNDEAVETIFKELEATKYTKSAKEYLHLLAFPAPTGKDKKRSLLAKYVNQYTARNTCDYFIHKDLGGLLRRELDFYIKNEVMRLDDIENSDVPAVESYLTKIKILRKISHKIIDFLAQLEDFQKKLWLKKKFVVETNYCITLDRIPEDLYPEIAGNEEQKEEWVKLFAIDEIKGDLHTRKYSEPLTVKFLKENPFLVVDTGFFDDESKERLIASIDDFDEQCDGLLIHSENFQALNLLQERYKQHVQCIYVDPPYNTGDDGFAYKDNDRSSSWLSMFNQATGLLIPLIEEMGSYFISCDENEALDLGQLLVQIFGHNNHVETITWNKRVPKNDKGIGNIHEYVYLFAKNQGLRRSTGKSFVMHKDGLEEIYELVKKAKQQGLSLEKTNEQLKKFYKKQGYDRGITLYCELDPNYELWGKINMAWPNPKTEGPRYEVVNPVTDKPTPIPKKGWRWTEETFRKAEKDGPEFKLPDGSMIRGRIWYATDENTQPSSITYLKNVESFLLRSIVSLKSDGSLQLENLGFSGLIDYPKPSKLMEWLFYSVQESSGWFLDFFAGSGTSGQALINLNRDDNGSRRFILVEMGIYYDTVLIPRLKKSIYSDSWKEGKPLTRSSSVSHCFKYLRLESYEDTLNNLRFNNNSKAYQSNPDLYEDYMLRYLLDVETRGSRSLLNIDSFADPCACKLKVKQPGSDEYVLKNVDLLETFNYLIGLRVVHIAAPMSFTAEFKREPDPELPENKQTRLIVDGRIKQDKNGPWWFRKVEGWIPADPINPNNGQKEKALIVWRKLTGDLEQDNLMLDEWFQKNRISARDFEFDTIYVNGSNNLPNLKLDDENWKDRLIEEEFMKRMWDVEGV